MRQEQWPLKSPFRIAGRSFEHADVLYLEVEENGVIGKAEAAGIFYLSDDIPSMMETIEALQEDIERGADRERLQTLALPGGARNALDCALWDLEAKQRRVRVWDILSLSVAPVNTVNTIGVGPLDEMSAAAKAIDAKHIKIKLDANEPVRAVEAVRAARPNATLVVDVNQGWTYDILRDVAPHLYALGVQMIEQPLPRGGDAALEGFRSPVPLCADESCLYSGELAGAAKRYQMINIKLDKTGGLTEALRLAAAARKLGLEIMAGNMLGTSLAMAPAFIVAQYCRFVDLDGPTLLADDRDHAMSYKDGIVTPPSPDLWG